MTLPQRFQKWRHQRLVARFERVAADYLRANGWKRHGIDDERFARTLSNVTRVATLAEAIRITRQGV